MQTAENKPGGGVLLALRKKKKKSVLRGDSEKGVDPTIAKEGGGGRSSLEAFRGDPSGGKGEPFR